MFGIFLLVCLVGIAVLWPVVGIVELRRRRTARREMDELVRARAAQLAERRRLYDVAPPRTSLTSVLEKLEASDVQPAPRRIAAGTDAPPITSPTTSVRMPIGTPTSGVVRPPPPPFRRAPRPG